MSPFAQDVESLKLAILRLAGRREFSRAPVRLPSAMATGSKARALDDDRVPVASKRSVNARRGERAMSIDRSPHRSATAARMTGIHRGDSWHECLRDKSKPRKV